MGFIDFNTSIIKLIVKSLESNRISQKISPIQFFPDIYGNIEQSFQSTKQRAIAMNLANKMLVVICWHSLYKEVGNNKKR